MSSKHFRLKLFAQNFSVVNVWTLNVSKGICKISCPMSSCSLVHGTGVLLTSFMCIFQHQLKAVVQPMILCNRTKYMQYEKDFGLTFPGLYCRAGVLHSNMSRIHYIMIQILDPNKRLQSFQQKFLARETMLCGTDIAILTCCYRYGKNNTHNSIVSFLQPQCETVGVKIIRSIILSSNLARASF